MTCRLIISAIFVRGRVDLLSVHGSNRLLRLLELFHHMRAVPQVDLRADKESLHKRAVSRYLREPLLLRVRKGRRRNHAEAHQEDDCLRVRERAQLVPGRSSPILRALSGPRTAAKTMAYVLAVSSRLGE
jgi:hypothetical protein